ncbi:arsenite methyltransferase [candidate division GN15 bacterium]|nr:arsenite methyltransferase [candidate division GN15 bacterium]
MADQKKSDKIKSAVREHYAQAIINKGGCCGPNLQTFDPDAAGRFVAMAGYTPDELKGLPEDVTTFGCGNPVALAQVAEGETVLDLGSGAGLDLILAAKKVGPTGRVIGLDMTPEMIETCRKNLERAGVTNGEVRMGEMEAMPVDDAEIDWIISNCVINLSPEKEKVFAESFRVLKPGGRLMVSDIVTIDLPEEYRDDLAAWAGCIAGAVSEEAYVELARRAGFVDVEIIEKLVYNEATIGALANESCGCSGSESNLNDAALAKYANRVASVKVSARKP